MEISFTIGELPRKELFTQFRLWASWPDEYLIRRVKVTDAFSASFDLPSRPLYDLDGIYLESELLINNTPTTHARAFFPLADLLQNERVSRKFADYHTPKEQVYEYGSLTASLVSEPTFELQTAPYFSKEEMIVNSLNWCKKRSDFWKQFSPINSEIETVVMNHFMASNGIPLPPDFYMLILGKPHSLATLRSCILYSCHVWQITESNFIKTLATLGKRPMYTWREFIAYNAIGFALELIAIGIIYHADEDIDLRTGKIEPTERMEMFIPTNRSDCEEKGMTINKVFASFMRQAKLSSDALILAFIRVLRYYVAMMTTNSTNDAALDKNNQLQTVIKGTSYDGHVTGLFIPSNLFYRRHPLLPHVDNYEARMERLPKNRPYLEVLFMEGTGYQSALMNTFSKYMGADGKRCLENIARVSRLLQESPLSKVLSTFIFNVRPFLAENETPNGFIRFVTSAYVCDLNEDGSQNIAQMEFRPFVEVSPGALRYGATMKHIMERTAFWVPSPSFDSNVVSNVLYWSQHFARGVPFEFSELPVSLPLTHAKGSMDENGCTISMLRGLHDLNEQDIREMDMYLTASEEFSHYDIRCVPMDVRSLMVLRVTPIVPQQKMTNLQRWFDRDFGKTPCLLMKWTQGVPRLSIFTLTIRCRTTGAEYDIRLSLEENVRNKMENFFRSLLMPSSLSLSFDNGLSMTVDDRSLTIPLSDILDVTLIARKVQEQTTRRMQSFFFGTKDTPTVNIDPVEKSISYSECSNTEERLITIPYVSYDYVETVPQRWTYMPSENTVVVPTGMRVIMPENGDEPTIITTPLEVMEMDVDDVDGGGDLEEVKKKYAEVNNNPVIEEPEESEEEEEHPIPDKDYYKQMEKETEKVLGGKDEIKKMIEETKNLTISTNREPFRPHICGTVQSDGSIQIDSDVLVENIHTKTTYRFRNTISLMRCFPAEFSVSVFCAEILPSRNIILFTFLYENNPVIVEFHYTTMALATVTQAESRFERNAAGLYVCGVLIPSNALSFIFLIVDPLATLCGIMIDLSKTFGIFEDGVLSLLENADDITTHTNLKRPRQIIETVGRNPVECKECIYDAKSGTIRALMPVVDNVYHAAIWNCPTLKTPPKTLNMQVTDDGIYVDNVLCGFPDNFMKINSTQPITDHQFADFLQFTPELSSSGCKLSANFLQIGMHLFMSYNKSHMCLFDDAAMVLYLMDIANGKTILRYDFSSSFDQFVTIRGSAFGFDLDAAQISELTWRQFFTVIYFTHLTIDYERADFLHYMNRFAEQVGVLCKTPPKHNFIIQVGSAAWGYSRSPEHFTEVNQISDMDQWLHTVGRTWEEKMLLIINIWINNANNVNFIGNQSSLHAKYNIEIRNLRF